MASNEEKRSYVEIMVPQSVQFPLNKVWLPGNAEVLVVNAVLPNNRNNDADPEVVHTVSEKQGNVAKPTASRLSASIRKTLWRERGNNRANENERNRSRYRKAVLNESQIERKSRLAKRRARYAHKHSNLDIDEQSEDNTWSKRSQSSAPNTESSKSSSQYSSDSELSLISNGVSELEGSVTSQSSRAEQCLEATDRDPDDDIKQYVYESRVETKVLKNYIHYLKPVHKLPQKFHGLTNWKRNYTGTNI
ncbi:hypothetical protein BWQ96_01125 [Gracilariopsis chorda]|uniref:Uncharacterized protein n=1 Tax=Gracilariopsis chorda TaxID=448386 RepID=A0A2V3J4R4_9FLOR|nr:hypothetical protein BWQ96_01125 [Gracilariopsis chorda]|eukprot:PXF48987.1 hypothetical protein BWQ96_01125 [Gracilariopsis chorda]